MTERLWVWIPAGVVGEFSSPELNLCADSYSLSIPPQCYCSGTKRPWSFSLKCRWQVTPEHAYTLDQTKSEWADYATVQAQCGNLSGNELTRNWWGTIKPQLSQVAVPLWTDPGLKSRISVHKSTGREWMVEHSSKILASKEKPPLPLHEVCASS